MTKAIEIANPIVGGSSYTSPKAAQRMIDRGRAIMRDGKLEFTTRSPRDPIEKKVMFDLPIQGNEQKPRIIKTNVRHKLKRGVYILRATNGLYKIGKTTNLFTRMKQCWIFAPDDSLVLFAFLPTNSETELEWRLHQTHANKREKGEWFRLSESDVVDLIEKGPFLLFEISIGDYLNESITF